MTASRVKVRRTTTRQGAAGPMPPARPRASSGTAVHADRDAPPRPPQPAKRTKFAAGGTKLTAAAKASGVSVKGSNGKHEVVPWRWRHREGAIAPKLMAAGTLGARRAARRRSAAHPAVMHESRAPPATR